MSELSARLIWVTEEGPQAYLLKPGDIITMGREPGNDIVIPLESISRKHARVEWIGSSFVLSDLGSANGTYVNSTRVGRVPWVLQDGDRLQLHNLRMRFELVAAPDEAEDLKPDSPEYAEQQARLRLPQTAIFRTSEENDSESFVSQKYGGPDFLPMPAPRRLVVSTGFDAGRVFDLNEPAITIGYAAHGVSYEIQLSDPTISQPHARLERQETEYQLVDLDSAKGTMLNGRPITGPTLLKEGDVIMLGEARLVYRGEE